MYATLSKLSNCTIIRSPNAAFAFLAYKGIGMAHYAESMAHFRSSAHPEDLLPFKLFETPQEKVTHTIWKISSPIVMTLGTIGNTLAIVVLSKKKMRRMPSSLFLFVLAVSDLLMLYIGLLRRCIKVYNDIDIRDFTLTGCKVHIFLVYFIKHFSAWLLVAVALERFISVWFPFRAKTICTHRNAALGVCAIAVALVGIHLHFFWTQGERIVHIANSNRTRRYACNQREKFDDFLNQIWSGLEASIFTYIPFTIMLLCNILIIFRLARARLQRRRLGATSHGSHDSIRMTTMTGMLLSATFTFLILNTPVSLYLSGQSTFWKEERRRNHNFEIFWVITQQLMYLNNAINFFLYFISSPRFRQELKKLFDVCRFNRTQIQPYASGQGTATRIHTITTGQSTL